MNTEHKPPIRVQSSDIDQSHPSHICFHVTKMKMKIVVNEKENALLRKKINLELSKTKTEKM